MLSYLARFGPTNCREIDYITDIYRGRWNFELIVWFRGRLPACWFHIYYIRLYKRGSISNGWLASSRSSLMTHRKHLVILPRKIIIKQLSEDVHPNEYDCSLANMWLQFSYKKDIPDLYMAHQLFTNQNAHSRGPRIWLTWLRSAIQWAAAAHETCLFDPGRRQIENQEERNCKSLEVLFSPKTTDNKLFYSAVISLVPHQEVERW